MKSPLPSCLGFLLVATDRTPSGDDAEAAMSDPPWLESLLNGYPCPSGSEWCEGESHTYKDTLETPMWPKEIGGHVRDPCRAPGTERVSKGWKGVLGTPPWGLRDKGESQSPP